MDLQPGRPLRKHEVVALLREARDRTLSLVAPLDDEDLAIGHGPCARALARELQHIARFEEIWLVERLANLGSGGTGAAGSEGLRDVCDPFGNSRSDRGETASPGRDDVLDYMEAVRRRVLSSLDALDLDAARPDGDAPLLKDGFVFRMVLQHEYGHNESMLQTLQLEKGEPYAAPRRPAAHDRTAPGRHAPPSASMVEFPGGAVRIGTDDRSEAYDHERPAHIVELEPFWIDATPVTNGQYLAFMADGGYRERALWSEAGWRWKEEEGAASPAYWFREDGRWRVRQMDRVREVDRARPVCHVCWWEAQAFAVWAGKRLPSEAEWEAAASWDPETATKRRFPWGDEAATPVRANVDGPLFDTVPVGSHPANVSAVGCHGMIGDVWEWTSSDFTAYPGFEAFPPRESSEAALGDGSKVLRGGSWATRAAAVRTTLRNRELPGRRQIFSGFRCARDAS